MAVRSGALFALENSSADRPLLTSSALSRDSIGRRVSLLSNRRTQRLDYPVLRGQEGSKPHHPARKVKCPHPGAKAPLRELEKAFLGWLGREREPQNLFSLYYAGGQTSQAHGSPKFKSTGRRAGPLQAAGPLSPACGEPGEGAPRRPGGTYTVFCLGRDRRPVTAARGLFCKRSYLPQDNCCAPRGAAERRLKMFFVHKPVPLCPRKPKAGLCVCTVGDAGQSSTTKRV